MYPDSLDCGAAFENLMLGRAGHRYDHDSACAFTKLFEPPANRRQRGLVADEQIPIEVVGHDERTPRPADHELVSWRRLRGPTRRRSGLVQREIDDALLTPRVEALGR